MIKLTLLAILASLMTQDSCALTPATQTAKQKREAFKALTGITYTDTVERAKSHNQKGNQVFKDSHKGAPQPTPAGSANQQDVKGRLKEILKQTDEKKFMDALRNSKITQLETNNTKIQMHVLGDSIYATSEDKTGKLQPSVIATMADFKMAFEAFIRGEI